MNKAYALVALAALFACSQEHTYSVCDLVGGGAALDGQHVRVAANGVFTRHGAYLRDARCPDKTILWAQAPEFSNDSLLDAISSEQVGKFRDIRVDVTGVYRRRASLPSPQLVVHVLHSFAVVEGTERQGNGK